MMKVLMVVNQLRAGGAEVLACDLSQGLAGLGVECSIAALHASSSDGDNFGVPTYVLGGRVAAHTVPAACYRLWQLCRRVRPDVVHSHGEAPDLACRLVCVLLRLPHVVSIHTERPWHWRPRLGRFLELWSAVLTNRYIAVSQVVADVVRKSFGVPGERVSLISNWPCELPERPSADDLPPRGKPTLIHVARLHVQKGQDLLLEAFAEVRKTWPGAVLWLVGTGPEEPRLRQLAGAGVVFLGHRHDVHRLLRQADLFVLSSHWEGLPLSMLEALAEGVPVVATRVGGVAEVVESGVTGLLVEAGDVPALVEAISYCLREPGQARVMAAEAQRRCQQRRPEALAAHLRLYAQVVAAGRAG